MMTSSDQVSF